MTTQQESVPVLIVGAGGAGLALSLLLRQQRMLSMVVERRSDVSWVPRARNLNFHTLEVFRGLGLEEEVRVVGTHASRIVRKESLGSEDEEELFDPGAIQPPGLEGISPEPFMLFCPQSRLEPVLLAAAKNQGCDVRYGTKLVSFAPGDTKVTATLEESATGKSYRPNTSLLPMELIATFGKLLASNRKDMECFRNTSFLFTSAHLGSR